MILKNVKSVSQGPGDGDTVPGTCHCSGHVTGFAGCRACTTVRPAWPGRSNTHLVSVSQKPSGGAHRNYTQKHQYARQVPLEHFSYTLL